MEFRKRILELAHYGGGGFDAFEIQEDLRAMCSRDILFFLNVFGWTYDPRKVPNTKLPWITWEFQDRAILELVSAIEEQHDCLIEKSRDMGATWMTVAVLAHKYAFESMLTFMVVSRVEDLVDDNENPDAIFWKIDFLFEHLPAFLQPVQTRTDLHFGNLANGSTIDGSSTTSDVGRGGRRTAVFMDEFAAVQNGHSMLSATADNTRCRIFNSTPKGTGNAHYTVSQWKSIRKLRLHWSEHPEKALGLYKTGRGGELEVIDKGYDYPVDYQFILDEKVRSPWYDGECLRRTPQEVAQELDIDYLGSGHQFFDQPVLKKCMDEYVCTPYSEGEIRFDEDFESIEYHPIHGGMLKLWINLREDGTPPNDRDYVIGIDASMGTGSSNSSLCVGDKSTGEKVAEFTTPFMKPNEFADYATAIGRWFHGESDEAFLIWEMNGGPGRLFGDRVIENNYKRIYFRRDDKSYTKKVTDKPGWFATREEKEVLLGEYRRALWGTLFINRSIESINEARFYVYLPGQGVESSQAMDIVDPSGASSRHGDRVIADALCWKGMKGFKKRSVQEVVIPPNCFFERQSRARLVPANADGWGD